MTRKPSVCIACGESPAPWVVVSKATGETVRVCAAHHAEVAGPPRATDLREQIKDRP
jgi:hypothetical protein